MKPATPPDHVDKPQLERLSLFRYELRRFLRSNEDAARDAGITAQQYQLLLHTQGFAGREWASIGELAQRLQTQPHAAVTMVTRCEEAGLVRRQPSDVDGRLVEVHLTAKGRHCLQRVAQRLGSELATLSGVIARAKSGTPGPDLR